MHVRGRGRQSSIGLSGIERAAIHGGFQRLGRFFACHGSCVGGFEPAVFCHLVRGDLVQRRFGLHDDDRLKLAVYFPRITVDNKFANIKFRHV